MDIEIISHTFKGSTTEHNTNILLLPDKEPNYIILTDKSQKNLCIINKEDLKNINTSEKKHEFIKIFVSACGLDIALAIQQILTSYDIYSKIVFDIAENDEALYIVIFPQLIKRFPKKFISYQLEQKNICPLGMNKRYDYILMKSEYIFDYSMFNYNNFSHEIQSKMLFCPIPLYSEIDATHELKNSDIDILFFGAIHSRRQKILIAIQKQLNPNYKTCILDNVYGDVLTKYIDRSKIIINIHYYDNALLETHRILKCLLRHKLVISEKPNTEDIINYKQFYDSVIFVEQLNSDKPDVSEIINKINTYINLENNKNFVNGINIKDIIEYNKLLMTRNLVSCDVLDYTKFIYPVKENDIYVIYPIEDTSKCTSFSSQTFIPNNVVKFPSVKKSTYDESYLLTLKILINSAKQQNIKNITICGIDTTFHKNFISNYEHLKTLLLQKNMWDIFIGLFSKHEEPTINKLDYIDDNLLDIKSNLLKIFNIYNSVSYDKILKSTNNITQIFYDCKIVTYCPLIVIQKE